MLIRYLATTAAILLCLGTVAAQSSPAQESATQDGATADGQAGTSPAASFTASGVHTVSIPAQRVRVLIPLVAHAVSTEEAIDLLRERKDAARERVLGLGADADSVRFGGVGVEDSESMINSNRSTLRMINAMGNTVDVDDLPVLHTARADMTAEWRLPEADEEATLAFVERIISSLKDPDVTGRDDRPEFSPKVEEALSTIRDQSVQYFSSESQREDSVRYIFVAKVPQQTVQESLRLAFEDARTQVDAMTQAAGFQRGRLVSMSSNSAPRFFSGRPDGFGWGAREDMLAVGRDEVGGAISSELKYVVQVQTQFSVDQ